MTLSDNAKLADFRAKAGRIDMVHFHAPDSSRTTPDRAAYATVTKALFNGRFATIRCGVADAVDMAGDQCLEQRRRA